MCYPFCSPKWGPRISIFLSAEKRKKTESRSFATLPTSPINFYLDPGNFQRWNEIKNDIKYPLFSIRFVLPFFNEEEDKCVPSRTATFTIYHFTINETLLNERERKRKATIICSTATALSEEKEEMVLFLSLIFSRGCWRMVAQLLGGTGHRAWKRV